MTEQALRDVEGHWFGPLGYEYDATLVGGRVVVTSPVDGTERIYEFGEVVTFVNKRLWRREPRANILGGP